MYQRIGRTPVMIVIAMVSGNGFPGDLNLPTAFSWGRVEGHQQAVCDVVRKIVGPRS
jgi:hypothetical protein